ncbi:PadR family transcriptional regulator [Marinicella sp. S1101]|uniref:PadR family transcriptional regulator n=1 Tax=Marinicella marina TaxID=2996016 RepID=UPI002260DC2A|nr:PadR family transcriptional regulator [Marinicella marina]MCX7554615.1 PadR family transcriptional regulator [Marinicella marina]MDJ1140680.1 PadR family transcriptional regulator [Marinicella marina]
MSLRHILLGILQQPKSGYDIKKMFDQVFNNFWGAELSQIYPQLRKLTDANMLTVQEEPSDKGPNKKIYHTTPAGKEELVQWLLSGPVTNTEKLAYLAQTYFLGSLDNNQQRLEFLEDLLEHLKIWHQTLLDVQQDMRQHFPDYPHGLPDEEFYPNLTLMLGVKKVGAKVEWAQESIELLKARM